MKYYVPVGPGGVFFRVGMAVTGMMGSLVYWRASRRRVAAGPMAISAPVGHIGLVTEWPEARGPNAAGLVVNSSASGGAAMAGTNRWRRAAGRFISQ
jgi:hypothetical protein